MQALPLRAVSPFLAVRGAAAVAVGAAGRAGASSLPGGARRAAGGGKFAAFKVKKANWVEVRASVYLGLCGLLRAAKQTRSRGRVRLRPATRGPRLRALQSNEILRENQFFTWSLSRSNMVGVAVMALAFPLAFHYLNKAELERRDVACVAGLGRRHRRARQPPARILAAHQCASPAAPRSQLPRPG
jgi:hypothetical protein